MRLAVVSDSHLARREPIGRANWDCLIRHLESTKPDFVVHTGDISLDGANDVDDLHHARAQLERIPSAWRAVPGNHDLGDSDDTPSTLVERRRQAYESVFGDRFWSTSLGDWRLVGLDSQHLTGTDESAEEWLRWVEAELESDQPTAVFQHRPLSPTAPDEVDTPKRYVTEPARSRLRALMARPNVKLVATGHVHQWRSQIIDGACHVWVPSTWATLPDALQPVIGTKVLGLVEIELASQPSVVLTTPEGVGPAVVHETFASPYGR